MEWRRWLAVSLEERGRGERGSVCLFVCVCVCTSHDGAGLSYTESHTTVDLFGPGTAEGNSQTATKTTPTH